MTNYDLARQLWEASGHPIPDKPTQPDDATRWPAARLLLEEALEAVETITGLPSPDLLEGTLHRFDEMRSYRGDIPLPDQNLVATAHKLADLLVATYGAGATHGFPVNDVYAEVCLSDLTKVDGEHQPPDVVRILEGGAPPEGEGVVPYIDHTGTQTGWQPTRDQRGGI